MPGELQFGKATKDCLPPGVRSRFRDNIEMKGKGKVWVVKATLIILSSVLGGGVEDVRARFFLNAVRLGMWNDKRTVQLDNTRSRFLYLVERGPSH